MLLLLLRAREHFSHCSSWARWSKACPIALKADFQANYKLTLTNTYARLVVLIQIYNNHNIMYQFKNYSRAKLFELACYYGRNLCAVVIISKISNNYDNTSYRRFKNYSRDKLFNRLEYGRNLLSLILENIKSLLADLIGATSLVKTTVNIHQIYDTL